MTLRGVGIDVADIARIGALVDCHGSRFQNRWFHAEEELGHQGELDVAAARCFAVKEAVWKALRQESSGPLPWRDIKAVPGPGEVVRVLLLGRLADDARTAGVGAITATATVRGDVVVAIAMIENSEAD